MKTGEKTKYVPINKLMKTQEGRNYLKCNAVDCSWALFVALFIVFIILPPWEYSLNHFQTNDPDYITILLYSAGFIITLMLFMFMTIPNLTYRKLFDKLGWKYERPIQEDEPSKQDNLSNGDQI